MLSDTFPKASPYFANYWLSGNQRWLVGLSRDELKYWDLRKGPVPEGDGDVKGFEGAVKRSCLADHRWLLLLNERRQAYFVDLESESELCAVAFLQLGQDQYQPQDEITAAGKHVLLAFAQPVAAFAWHVSSFEALKRTKCLRR